MSGTVPSDARAGTRPGRRLSDPSPHALNLKRKSFLLAPIDQQHCRQLTESLLVTGRPDHPKPLVAANPAAAALLTLSAASQQHPRHLHDSERSCYREAAVLRSRNLVQRPAAALHVVHRNEQVCRLLLTGLGRPAVPSELPGLQPASCSARPAPPLRSRSQLLLA